MVLLNRIYTRAGDDGNTRLASGQTVSKDDPRVAAYGSVDETNAAIGIARLYLDPADDMLANALLRIQNDLFDLGADLATPDTGEPLSWEPLRIIPAQVQRLEHEIDAMNASLGALDSFILPAGSAASAHLHLARTICRRAEREAVTFARTLTVPAHAQAIIYLNRLSDFLFVAARRANDNGARDVKWVPAQNRT